MSQNRVTMRTNPPSHKDACPTRAAMGMEGDCGMCAAKKTLLQRWNTFIDGNVPAYVAGIVCGVGLLFIVFATCFYGRLRDDKRAGDALHEQQTQKIIQLQGDRAARNLEAAMGTRYMRENGLYIAPKLDKPVDAEYSGVHLAPDNSEIKHGEEKETKTICPRCARGP